MLSVSKETVKKYRIYLCEEEKSENTIEKYMRDINYFLAWTEQRAITKSILIDYKKMLCEKYAPASVNSMLSALNAFFAYLGHSELKIKTLKIQHRVFCDKTKELTKREYTKLLCCARSNSNDKLYYLMQTIGSTGIRVSELKYITVESVEQGVAMINCKGKLRQVLIPSQLRTILKKYIVCEKIKNGSVFVSKNGKPLNRTSIWRMMKGLCGQSGVSKEKVFPHNFRHLFARTFYSIQKDIVRLADVLGHSNINTTRIYTTEAGEIHERQLQQLGLLLC